MRDPDPEVLERLARDCEALAGEVAAARGITVELRPMSATLPAPCAPRVQAAIEAACASLGLASQRLYSAAGHDAQNLAGVTDSGMIFIPSRGGRSHRVDEMSDWAAIARAARARPDAPLPAQIRGHTFLELAWTIVPALVLLVIAIPTIQIIFRTQSQAAPPRGLAVQVRGWQWWWEFRYPDLDVVTANELHLPVGRTIVIHLEGPDVIHSFWVPHLGGKRDVVPGRHNRIVLTPDRPGEHWGQCAEFCGASHANMGMRVIVQPAAEFDAWVARQRAAPAEPSGLAAEGKAIFAKSACVGCHTIEGVSAGMLGP